MTAGHQSHDGSVAESPRDGPTQALSASERAAEGRAARSAATRSSHSALTAGPDRDPVAVLEEEAKTRDPELVPIRYGRMLGSPFAFFRGAAGVMAQDLSTTPVSGLRVQLCGDAHLLNFGGFASPERKLVFDVNDFDETLEGPFEWDVKRLSASVEIVGRQRGFTSAEREPATLAAVGSYRLTLRDLAKLGNLDVWYADADAASLADELRAEHDRQDVRKIERVEARARTSDSVHSLAKLTRPVNGRPQIVSDPPMIVPISELAGDSPELEQSLRRTYGSYRRSLPHDRRGLLEAFAYGDLARKVVGIGSVGRQCWILLLFGRDDRDPLFLQLKEADRSLLEPHLRRTEFANQGERVVEGQRLAQASSDIFLGWTQAEDDDGTSRDFYVRQLRDWKVSVDVEGIQPTELALYARWCGAALARAHARSGDRIAIAAYLGKSDRFDRAVAKFSRAYADLNASDHAALAQAVREGRIVATEGV